MSDATIYDLIAYLDESVTAFHAVITAENKLKSAGYTRLYEADAWELAPNEKYYVIRGESGLVAWKMGAETQQGVRLIGAHTDSPGLHLKPNAQYSTSGYVQFGVEVYGGPLLGSWTDRDLSLAGRVVLKESGRLKVRPFRSKSVLLRVPQLAIHLNREVNDKGLILNKQTHMPPVAGLEIDGEVVDSNLLNKLIAKELDIDIKRIHSSKLECYDTHSAALSGLNQEFIVSGRIDNLTMCHAALEALINSHDSNPQTAMIALFDNEEIGSSTSNGAASSMMRDIIERVIGRSGEKQAFQRGLAQSMCISADGAHGVHPNYVEYHDPQHAVKMNQGPVIKVNANHRYATGALTAAIFENLCTDVDVPVQYYAHKTDLPCGSTIGPITATGLGIPVVDVGNAMLSMHSIREMAGVADHAMMIKVLTHYFEKQELAKV